MRINHALIDDLIELATEEHLERDGYVGRHGQIQILKTWVSDMEDDKPRNRAEKHLFEHLEFAIDHLVKMHEPAPCCT